MEKKESGYRVLIVGNKCYRCGHEWKPDNIDTPPKVCPKCKSPYWDRPRSSKTTVGVLDRCSKCEDFIGTNEIEQEGWKKLSKAGDVLKLLCPKCQKKDKK